MTENKNEQNKPGKLQRIVGKFDFLSVAAVVIIIVALLSSLLEKSK
jgi:hypothetical protein